MGPYAYRLGIKQDELSDYLPKSALLMAQINLLEDSFRQIHALKAQELRQKEAWVKHVLDPWIRSDRHLKLIMADLYSTQDLLDPAFVNWLRERVPPNWQTP